MSSTKEKNLCVPEIIVRIKSDCAFHGSQEKGNQYLLKMVKNRISPHVELVSE